MATFKDCDGVKHKIEFDAFALEDLREAAGIDLADLSAGGLEAIHRDATTLAKVIESLLSRDVAKKVRGESIAEARKAIEVALADFFPASDWSLMQSNLMKRKAGQEAIATGQQAREMWEVMEPLVPFFQAVDRMPPAMREGALSEARKKLTEAGADPSDLDILLAAASAGGQDSTPSKPATDSPENAESQPEG